MKSDSNSNSNAVCPYCQIVVAKFDPERTLVDGVPMHGRCARAVQRKEAAAKAKKHIANMVLDTAVLQ